MAYIVIFKKTAVFNFQVYFAKINSHEELSYLFFCLYNFKFYRETLLFFFLLTTILCFFRNGLFTNFLFLNFFRVFLFAPFGNFENEYLILKIITR